MPVRMSLYESCSREATPIARQATILLRTYKVGASASGGMSVDAQYAVNLDLVPIWSIVSTIISNRSFYKSM